MPPDDQTPPQKRARAAWMQAEVDNFVNHAGYEDGLPFVKSFLEKYGAFAIDLANSKDETAFLRAADHGRTEILNFLSAQGATTDLTQEELPLIHWLARRGNRASVEWLLAREIPVDLRGGKGNSTPLLMAAQSPHADVLRVLIAAGAEVDARDSAGNTPLIVACMLGSGAGATLLIQSGAEIETRNDNGSSPLEMALLFRNTGAASALLDDGADPRRRDHAGRSPADIAADRGLAEWLDAECRRCGDAIAGKMSGGLEKPVQVRRLRLKTPGMG